MKLAALADTPAGPLLCHVGPTGEISGYALGSRDGVSSNEGALRAAFAGLGLAEPPRPGTRFGDVHTFVHQARALGDKSAPERRPIEAQLARGALRLAAAKNLPVSQDVTRRLRPLLDGDGGDETGMSRLRLPRADDVRCSEPVALETALEEIRVLLQAYSYNQYNLLESSLSILCNPNQGALLIDGFYRYGEFSTEGNCQELAVTAWRDILALYPHLSLRLVMGNEPRFFSNPNSSRHWFLILDAPNGESYVVDPTFGKVVPYAGSGYWIRDSYRIGDGLDLSNQRLLPHGHATPLGLTAEGKLIYLSANFYSQRRMDIEVKNPGDRMRRRDLSEAVAESLAIEGNDPRLSRVIRLLAGTALKISGNLLRPNIQVKLE